MLLSSSSDDSLPGGAVRLTVSELSWLAGSRVVVLNSCSATMYGLRIFLWLIGLVYYIGHPQPPQLNWARVYCGCQPGPTRVVSPSRQDDGETRAPALHTLDDVLRFRGDEEYRAVLLHPSSTCSCLRSGRSWEHVRHLTTESLSSSTVLSAA